MEKIVCPPEMVENCPVYELEGECYQDRHHLYWPTSAYSSRVDKQFRQLEVNKVEICRWIHNTIHAVALPPEKPNRNEMVQIILEEDR